MQKVIHCGIFHDNTVFVMARPITAIGLVQTFFAWEGSKDTNTYENILLLFLIYVLFIVIKKISAEFNSFHLWENNVHRVCK